MKGAMLREQIDKHCGDAKRVTVFWSCGRTILCTSGRIVDWFDDVIVVVGPVPTVAESRRGHCRDLAEIELATLIGIERICGIVVGLPHCRKAALPRCCSGHDPVGGESDGADDDDGGCSEPA